uniref:restriction endonuclease subunit S n=6 Tax=Bifidobacterium longum TaxID=216816 RepID=UPI001C7019B7
FAGFTDPWEQRKLGEIVSIGAGAPPSAFSAGNFLYVKVDDLNESSHFQFDSAQRVDANTAVKPIRKGSIIFAKRGAAILGNKVRVLGKTAYIDTNMMALEPRGVDADFLWLFINQTGLYRIADTSTIPQINNKHIEPYPVDIPNMAEQQAIGTFFSRLDDLITLHQRKYDKLVIFKKSMLEKMFPKDGESVPEIRFAGFTDPWEQRKLGEIVSIGAGAPPSAFSAGNFLYVKVDDLNESSHFQFDSAQRVDANTAVKPIRKGSIIFAKRGAAILGNKVRVLGKTAYIDTNMMALEPRGVDADFLWLFINQTGLYRIADTSTIPQINNKHIEPYPVDIPNMAEQQAIGTFFSRLDDLITLHQRKYDKLVIFKKSMLEKMFPKDGESVPEIRFAGFTDPWEQRKLGEIVSIGAGAPPSAFSAGNFLYVKVDDLNESSHFQFDSAQRVDANTAVKPIRKGSIIFAKRGAAILGNKVRVLGKTAYIDTNMMALEPRGVDADFLWLFINQTGLYRIADTSTIPQINNKHIEPYPVDIPNMAEQQAIGTFFSRLDDLITLHQRKLELLQDIKKSLLDKMFV